MRVLRKATNHLIDPALPTMFNIMSTYTCMYVYVCMYGRTCIRLSPSSISPLPPPYTLPTILSFRLPCWLASALHNIFFPPKFFGVVLTLGLRGCAEEYQALNYVDFAVKERQAGNDRE